VGTLFRYQVDLSCHVSDCPHRATNEIIGEHVNVCCRRASISSCPTGQSGGNRPAGGAIVAYLLLLLLLVIAIATVGGLIYKKDRVMQVYEAG
jgi:hypothetical protein